MTHGIVEQYLKKRAALTSSLKCHILPLLLLLYTLKTIYMLKYKRSLHIHSSSNKDHKIIELSTNFFLQCLSQCTFLYPTHTIALVGERRPTVWHIALISICHKSVWDSVFYCRTGRQRQRQRGMSEKTETECRGFVLRFGIWKRIFSCLSVCLSNLLPAPLPT